MMTSMCEAQEVQEIQEEGFLVGEETKELSCSKDDFVSGLESVLPAVWAYNDPRTTIEGVLFESFDLSCNIVATDTFRLHKNIIASTGEEFAFILCDNKKRCLPGSEPLTSIVKQIKKSKRNDDITIYVNDNYCQIWHGGTSYLASVVSGQFPNYRKVMPVKFEHFAEFNDYHITGIREELNKITGGAKLNKKAVFINYDNEMHQRVVLHLQDEGFSIEAGANFPEYISGLYRTKTGFNQSLAYNGCFLQDIFKSVNKDAGASVKFEARGTDLMVLFVESGTFTGVLMPMLLQ